MLRVATVCSGIGAPETALRKLDIPYELVFFSEIDKWAIKSYCAINKEDAAKNIGDLKNFFHKALTGEIDLLVGGTPCQDFSLAGKGAGGELGSNTRSSLMWTYLKMIAVLKPRVVIWENVPAVIFGKHYRNYKNFFFKLQSLGYKVDAKILNAKYFNLPQNRERLLLVAQRKDCAVSFSFPTGYDSGIRLKDIMLDGVPPPARTPPFRLFKISHSNEHRIIQCGVLLGRNFKQGNSVISAEGISECLTTKTGNWILCRDGKIRPLNAHERFLAMGFSHKDFIACKNAGVPSSELIKQAGNSIAVTVLMALFGEIYGVPWKCKVYGKNHKTQRQLLHELPLFRGITNDNNKSDLQHGLSGRHESDD